MFTYPWDDDAPVGSDAANLIHQYIQDFKKGLRERLEASVITDFSTDPLVLLPEVSGLVTGLEYMIPGAAFKGDQGSYDETNGVFLNPTLGGAGAVAAIMIPRGCVISDIFVYAKINSGADSTIYIKHTDISNTSGVADVDFTLNLPNNANGLFNPYTDTPALTLAAGSFYFLFYSGHVTDKIMGVKLLFDRSSHLLG